MTRVIGMRLPALFAESLKMKIDLLGEDHFERDRYAGNDDLAQTCSRKNTAAALAYGARAWAGATEIVAGRNPNISYAAITYAQALMQANQAREALPPGRNGIETAQGKSRLPTVSTSSIFESVPALAQARRRATSQAERRWHIRLAERQLAKPRRQAPIDRGGRQGAS